MHVYIYIYHSRICIHDNICSRRGERYERKGPGKIIQSCSGHVVVLPYIRKCLPGCKKKHACQAGFASLSPEILPSLGPPLPDQISKLFSDSWVTVAQAAHESLLAIIALSVMFSRGVPSQLACGLYVCLASLLTFVESSAGNPVRDRPDGSEPIVFLRTGPVRLDSPSAW